MSDQNNIDPMIDHTVNPIDDFNNYVNGTWIRTTKIPDDQSDWGTFDILNELNNNLIRLMLESLSVTPDDKHHIIGKIYKKFMNHNVDSDQICITKIRKYIDMIDGVQSLQDFGRLIGQLAQIGVDPFFIVDATEDPKDTTTVRANFWMADLSLPDRNYYLDKKMGKYTEGLQENIADIFGSIGYNKQDSLNISNDCLYVEKLLATIQPSAEKKRDLDLLYNILSIEQFIHMIEMSCDKIKMYSDRINGRIGDFWTNYFTSSGIYSDQQIIIYCLQYFKKMSIILQMVPLEKLKNMVKYVVVKNLGAITIDGLDQILFNFYGKKLNGSVVIMERYKRVLYFLNNHIGMIIGESYVEKFFDPTSKKIVNHMVDMIKYEMALAIKNAKWIDDMTKAKAYKKLKYFTTKIGYPDEWKDNRKILDRLKQNQDMDMFDLMLILKQYDYQTKVLDHINRPRDINKWSMNPHDVNAYYDPHRNEIVFPAGILQYPFFNKDQSIAKNYGGIGTVIAHEITHGYDDQGRKYDYRGHLDNWWNDSDLMNYNNITKKLLDQYNNYKIDGMQINGLLTLGENLADLGGCTLAYRAMCRDDQTADKKDFFINFANIWKKIIRPEKLTSQILSNPHSPAKYRIFILRNIDEFYQAFDSGQPIDRSDKTETMYLEPSQRVRMW
jgi:putative endopeptidase